MRQADFAAGDELEDFLDLIEVAAGNQRRDEFACLARHCRGKISPLLRVVLATNQGDDRGPVSFGLQLAELFLPLAVVRRIAELIDERQQLWG